MKKLLITFVLLLTTLLTFGQDSPYYLRGLSFEIGHKDSNSNITWDEKSSKDCNVLIKLNETDVTIYSKITQRYYVITFEGKTDNGGSKWYCSDSSGKYCNIYMAPIKGYPGYLSLTIEFSDLVWFYICKPTN